jgi:hypothetical protein
MKEGGVPSKVENEDRICIGHPVSLVGLHELRKERENA